MSEAPPPKKKERKKEHFGTVLYVGNGKGYEIESLLGSGGFCDVYKVCLTKDREKKFAMKTERFDYVDEDRRKMKIETCVFVKLWEGSQKIMDKSHFPKMIDFGKTPQYKFLIMEIMGPALVDIRAKMMEGKTSPRTIAEVARQTLRAMESLHEIGYLHRDIKPHNFAIGLPPKETTIFMLDFGMAKPFRHPNGLIRAPRLKARWCGTRRYASHRGLKGEDQSRRDDVEIWCFMMLEYYWKHNLLWSWNVYELPMIIAMKEKWMTDSLDLRAKGNLRLPQRFCEILTMTSKLSFTACPEYAKMNAILEQIIKDEKIDMTLPLDWIGRKMPVEEQKEKPKEKPNEKNEKASGVESYTDLRDLDPIERKKALEKRKKEVLEELEELYKNFDSRTSKEKKRRRRRSSKRDEEEESESSEDDDSEDSRRHRRRGRHGHGRRRSRKRSPRDYSARDRTPPEEEERRRRRREERKKERRVDKESRDERKKVAGSDRDRADNPKDKERDRKKTKASENTAEKEKDKEREAKKDQKLTEAPKSKEVEKKKEDSPAKKEGKKDEKEKKHETENEKKKEKEKKKEESPGKKDEKPKEKEKKSEEKPKKEEKDKEKPKEKKEMKKEEAKKKDDEKKPVEKEKVSPSKATPAPSSNTSNAAEAAVKKETVDPKKK